MLKQFRIFNGLITRFLNAKFLKADQEKEILVNTCKETIYLANKLLNLKIFY